MSIRCRQKGAYVARTDEQLIPLAEAGLLFRLPVPPHPATRHRWALRGVRPTRGGERIKLETVKIGGRRYTTHEAVERFADEETRPSGQRATEINAAEQSLDADGVG
jgi:hypothetical protein